MLAGELETFLFAWNGSQAFEDLEAKQSVMIHCVKPTFISITGACAFTTMPSIEIHRITQFIVASVNYKTFKVFHIIFLVIEDKNYKLLPTS